MNGETRTGVTSFFLNRQIDTGDIIGTTEVEIGPAETTGELYERLMHCGAELAVHTLDLVESGQAQTRRQQESADLKPAPKIFKEDTFIDWSLPARDIFNKIRGLSPFPGACTRITNRKGETELVKILEAEITPLNAEKQTGTIEIEATNSFKIYAKEGQISVKTIQFQGKSRQKIGDFLNGFHPENYELKFL